jgi:hypothetical protein
MSTLNSAINVYLVDSGGTGFLGTSSVVYVSIPSTSTTCANLGLPSLPTGYSYSCVPATSSRNTNGTGWIPINLASTSSGTPLGSLPIDPVNTTSSGYYYTYVTNGGGNYELTMVPESQKEAPVAASDGGVDPASYETGNKLTLSPFAHGLVGYWPMNESSGLTLYDLSGWGRNSVLNTSAATTTGCLLGSSCQYFSTSITANSIYGNDVNGTYFETRIVWIQPVNIPGNILNGVVFYNLWDWLDVDADLGISVRHVNIPGQIWTSPSNIFSYNQWSMIANTFNGLTGQSITYFNGQPIGTESFSPPKNISLYRGIDRIGGCTAANQCYAGWISNVRWYNRALTPAQIQAIYNAKQ